MSIENIKSFWTEVQANETLRRELTAMRSDQDVAALAEVTALASRHGFIFTAQEYQAALRARLANELQPLDGLSDAELDLVAGGVCCQNCTSAGGPYSN